MLLKFSKMHGLGNDFMVIDLVTQHARIDQALIQQWADRHLGIGFDQLLLVEPPQDPKADFRYRIFNADGNEVEQCGNGARCFARFVRDNRLTTKQTILVETSSGLITLQINDDNSITVNMGEPVLNPADIPFAASHYQTLYDIDIEGQAFTLAAVSMGNPHAVLCVEDVDSAPLAELGPQIEHHVSFPQRVNVGFMQILNRQALRLRVFERGVGETRACGTGACAAVVAGIQQGLLDTSVNVQLPGGDLKIEWLGEGHSLTMTGPASMVYRGQVKL